MSFSRRGILGSLLIGIFASVFHVSAAAKPVDYTYQIVSPKKIQEKEKGSLNDGSLKTGAVWKGRNGAVVCEFPEAAEVAAVTIAAVLPSPSKSINAALQVLLLIPGTAVVVPHFIVAAELN